MNVHPKSYVYEYIAKHNDLDLPDINYIHKYIKEGNMNKYKCNMCTNYKNNKINIDSEYCTNKKQAEKIVYEKLLNILNHNNLNHDNMDHIKLDSEDINNNIIDSDRENKIVYLIVDYENISNDKEIKKLYQYINTKQDSANHYKIIKIAGYCSSVKSKADIVVRSNRCNAVDHYISYYIGILNSKNPKNKIHILTRDKFGSCLQDFCPNVQHNVDIDDFIESCK